MRIAVFGGMGRMGARHAASIARLGHEPIISDPRVPDAKFDLTGEALIAAVDAVVVASPPATHAHYLLATLAQKKPVFVEKPLITAYQAGLECYRDEIEAMIEEAGEAGKLSAVGFNMRFRPQVRKARALIRHKGLYYSSFVCAHYGENRDVVDDWLCHEIDLALHLLGPVIAVTARGNETAVDVLLLHQGHFSFRSHVHSDTRLLDSFREFHLFADSHHYRFELPLADSGPDYEAEMSAWLRAIVTKTPSQRLASLRDGLAVAKICSEVKGQIKESGSGNI